jgi:hypothetical protein
MAWAWQLAAAVAVLVTIAALATAQNTYTADVRLVSMTTTGDCDGWPAPVRCDVQCTCGVSINSGASYATSGWSSEVGDNNSPSWGTGGPVASVTSGGLYSGSLHYRITCRDNDGIGSEDLGTYVHASALRILPSTHPIHAQFVILGHC